MTKTYEFDVKMTCGGCSGAVNRALGKVEGLESYDVNLEKQTVVVHPGKVSYEDVLEKIKKTGKEVRSGKVVDSDEESTEAKEESTSAAPAPPEIVTA